MGVRQIFTYLAQGHVIVTKIFSANLNIRTHRLTDMFGEKSAKCTGAHIFGIWVFEN